MSEQIRTIRAGDIWDRVQNRSDYAMLEFVPVEAVEQMLSDHVAAKQSAVAAERERSEKALNEIRSQCDAVNAGRFDAAGAIKAIRHISNAALMGIPAVEEIQRRLP